MIDCIIAWILLIIGIGTQDAEWFIASGLFSISSYLSFGIGKIKIRSRYG